MNTTITTTTREAVQLTPVQLSYIRETYLSPLITPPDSLYCEAYLFCGAYADEDDYGSFLTKTLDHFVATSGADNGGEYHTPTQHEVAEHLLAYYIEYRGADRSQEHIDGIRDALQRVVVKQYPAFCKKFKEKADFAVYIANGGEFVF